MSPSEDARTNRARWDRISDEYQTKHGPQLDTRELAWGIWAIPEDELRILGEVAGKDILEFGCGAAQWSIFLAKRGARPVGLDISARQLAYAQQNKAKAAVHFSLVLASGEAVPFADASFDIVFCDHGAMSFADPTRTVPEAARLLRPGGLLAFNMTSPLLFLCWNAQTDQVDLELHHDYFALGRSASAESVEYQLPYGEWIRLFRRYGFVVEDLVELKPPEGATTTHDDIAPLDWQRHWPAENIWKVRKQG